MTEPVRRWRHWDGEQWADAGASDLHIVAAEVAGRIVAGDASVPDKLRVGATNGGAIGGGGRFTIDELGDRWESLANRVLRWLQRHDVPPAPVDTMPPTARQLLDGPLPIRNPYEQP
jgi:hypothetical protein